MSHKITQTRKNAFLAALRVSGNQTLAAERVGVSRSWVQLHWTRSPQLMPRAGRRSGRPRALGLRG